MKILSQPKKQETEPLGRTTALPVTARSMSKVPTTSSITQWNLLAIARYPKHSIFISTLETSVSILILAIVTGLQVFRTSSIRTLHLWMMGSTGLLMNLIIWQIIRWLGLLLATPGLVSRHQLTGNNLSHQVRGKQLLLMEAQEQPIRIWFNQRRIETLHKKKVKINNKTKLKPPQRTLRRDKKIWINHSNKIHLAQQATCLDLE